METAKLKKFAQFARRSLIDQVSAKLNRVLAVNSSARRENAAVIKKLEEAVESQGQDHVIDRVAYIWFNRFCALRFMDVNRYTRIAVVSPAEGQFQPEILAEAKMGHIDEEMVPAEVQQQIVDLLSGKAPSRDPQGEVYSLLVVAACNSWNVAMPFLFERIDDYTELLMPDDLLSGKSILAYTREAMTPDACQDVEVIGWLYQFYISEKKDEVFDGLKKNRKITPANIPAATQLFTPHWIVRYLVENSLGRLWMLNRPNSKLIEQMDYYIKPEEPETDFLRIGKPEEIKICDPACGSGHMLTYAFDLLYSIYEEEGYDPAGIPEKILTHNLHGIEIDERAGELAAFALTMKARAKQRRYFRDPVLPKICVLQNVQFDEGELKNYMDFVGQDLFTIPLLSTLHQFEEADNFGSLIRPDVTDVAGMLEILELRNVSGQLFLSSTHQKVLQALQQADYLSPKYHVVIANPPYMGSGGMNGRLASWAKDNYPESKSDLFAMFMVRNLVLARSQGSVAMITMQSWMFLSSFETLRARIVGQTTLITMAHLGSRAFDSIGGEVVSTTAFILDNKQNKAYRGGYLRLVEGNSEAEKMSAIQEACRNTRCGWFYRARTSDFTMIPGSPIAYWLGNGALQAFTKGKFLRDVATTRVGMATGDNGRFVRLWSEVSFSKIGYGFTREEAAQSKKQWFPYSNGGEAKKWYANYSDIVNWEDDGKILQSEKHESGRVRAHNFNLDMIFKSGLTWSLINTRYNAIRILPAGFLFSSGAPSLFVRNADELFVICGYYNSVVTQHLLRAINPTINNNSGDADKLPYCFSSEQKALVREVVDETISLAKEDWNSYETAWDFVSLPLLHPNYHQPTLKERYQKLRAYWHETTLKMQQQEELNNRIFIEAYSLQDELKSDVPLSEITLTSNPHYRYDNGKSAEELEAMLLADTIRELISYAVGCMFGRYALEKPGMIVANQGETIEDYLNHVPEPSFPADDDNVIPMLDGDWFSDDISERFRKFLRVAFDEDHYEENLKFIEAALNVKGKRDYSLRDYFLQEFYSDHVKRYKKRPIYWLFSSPKGSFNALIYMHRYRSDTVSVVLNDYLREFRNKLTSNRDHLEAVSISASATQGEKTKALKDIEKVTKMITELEEYEREVLYPLATKQLEIDLDDGVKVNYPKFGAALKRIPGLDSEEE